MTGLQTSTGPFGNNRQTVIHYPERQCFASRTDDSGTDRGGEAILEYSLLANRGINFHHTFVPEALRGQGIAETLVRAGLAWAGQEGLRIEASCWYVQRFLRA